MFYSLRGKLIHIEPGAAVVECGGIGFKCGVSMSTQAGLPAVGGDAFLYTHMAISQDNVSLYGFATREELSCFKMLTAVSGIGSKTAVAVLSALSPEQIAVSVASGDFKALTRANGIGPKQAQRIVLELKDKVSGLGAPDMGTVQVASGGVPIRGASKSSEAIGALMVLGCAADEAARLVSGLDPEMTVEQMIAGALKAMNN